MKLRKFTVVAINSILVILPLAACSTSISITEKIISLEEQKEYCDDAKSVYENAQDSYKRQLDRSVERTGKYITHSNLDTAYEEAQKLASYQASLDEALSTKEFWCDKVKPNSVLYKRGDNVYLTREAAEKVK